MTTEVTVKTGTVLVVDDEASIRELVSLTLLDEGYQVVTAVHGVDALQQLNSVSPCVILLDMRMPVMDGWAFARAYRQLSGPKAPLVVLTAATDAAAFAAQVQADGFLAKPFDLGHLIELVEHYCPESL
ncbi:MAG TPA: response regulator [Chloroflexia bacterium]|nr:response regulator [Chloroflexia bacterium]